MINKNIVILVSILILVIALMTVFNFSSEKDTDNNTVIEGDNNFSDDDVVNEIDITLLNEDGGIDIGELI